MNETTLRCTDCGKELTEENYFLFNGEIYCEDCLDSITVECDHCGSRVYRRDAYSDSNYTLCPECYYDHYSTCEECGALIPNGDVYYIDDYEDYPYCYSCYVSKNRHRSIHDYNYKPYPIFYGEDNRFFGIELEVDDGGHSENNADKILNIANPDYEDYLYIKHDGSLDDGFEIVSHPMSLDYHKRNMPWQKIMDSLIGMGYMSHKTSTCGLHCHVNRTAFGETYNEQEEAIGRVLYFVEHHWTEMLRFSRRTEGQMQRWAARYGLKSKPKDLMDDAKNNNYTRYRCINLQNCYTIEFRMFRGTLKYNTFIATLQLVNEICNVAVSLSDEEMTELSWKDFINGIDKDKNTELFTYLGERNLI